MCGIVGGVAERSITEVLIEGLKRLEYRGYDKDDAPLFQKTRRDSQYDFVVGTNYIPARNWKITTRLNLTVNESNIELNKYRREAVSVTVRRDF